MGARYKSPSKFEFEYGAWFRVAPSRIPIIKGPWHLCIKASDRSLVSAACGFECNWNWVHPQYKDHSARPYGDICAECLRVSGLLAESIANGAEIASAHRDKEVCYTLFKPLNEKGQSVDADFYMWPLPKQEGRPGRRTSRIRNAEWYTRGYHLFDLIECLDVIGDCLWLAEGYYLRAHASGVWLFEQARLLRKVGWDIKVLDRFTIHCCKRVMHFVAELDSRPREIIETAERYVQGRASMSDVNESLEVALDLAEEVRKQKTYLSPATQAAYTLTHAVNKMLCGFNELGLAKYNASEAVKYYVKAFVFSAMKTHSVDRQTPCRVNDIYAREHEWQSDTLLRLINTSIEKPISFGKGDE